MIPPLKCSMPSSMAKPATSVVGPGWVVIGRKGNFRLLCTNGKCIGRRALPADVVFIDPEAEYCGASRARLVMTMPSSLPRWTDVWRLVRVAI